MMIVIVVMVNSYVVLTLNFLLIDFIGKTDILKWIGMSSSLLYLLQHIAVMRREK